MFSGSTIDYPLYQKINNPSIFNSLSKISASEKGKIIESIDGFASALSYTTEGSGKQRNVLMIYFFY